MSSQLPQLLSSLLQTPGDESTLTAIREWAAAGPAAGDAAEALARLEAGVAELGKAGRWSEAVALLEALLPLAEGLRQAELLVVQGRIERSRCTT